MNIPRPIDHELVTLLHEITDDPAKLMAGFTNRLRTTKHELPKTLGLDEDAFFNQSERRLLRRHREEIGDLLYERCLQFMQETPSTKSRIDWDYKGASQKSIQRRNRVALSFLESVDSSDSAEVARMLIQDVDQNDVVSLSELAHRFRPSFFTKHLMVLALKEACELSRALGMISTIDKGSLGVRAYGKALGCKAFVLCAANELDEARLAARESYRCDDSRARSAANWATLELCCGEREGIRDSSITLESYADSDELNFADFELGLRSTHSDYRPNLQLSQVKMIASMAEGLPSRARKLANAIVQ